jgi:hypothetical protein
MKARFGAMSTAYVAIAPNLTPLDETFCRVPVPPFGPRSLHRHGPHMAVKCSRGEPYGSAELPGASPF